MSELCRLHRSLVLYYRKVFKPIIQLVDMKSAVLVPAPVSESMIIFEI